MRGDPYWLNARFGGTCGSKGCTDEIKKGDRVFYYPMARNGHQAFVGECAEAAARDFNSCMFDEGGF